MNSALIPENGYPSSLASATFAVVKFLCLK